MSSVLAKAQRVPPRAILAIAWLAGIVYAYPGYMNFDTAVQVAQSRSHQITDWHPPIMAAYWRLIELVVAGPLGLLLIQSILFEYGVYKLLRLRLSERAAAWLTAAVILFPPVLTPMANVWKDSQMAGFLLGGAALALQPGRRARVAGIALVVLAAAVRYNCGAALPPLGLVVVTAWGVRALWARIALVFAFLVATFVVTGAVNRSLAVQREYTWYRMPAMFDIVGTACYAPPLSDAELQKLLDGVTIYQPHDIQKLFCDYYSPREREPWFGYGGLFPWQPTKAERLARRRAWVRMIEQFPGAYLRARLELAKHLLGLSADLPWEPVGQDSLTLDQRREISHDTIHSGVQNALGDAFRWLAADTPLYRAWIYALLAVLAFGWAVWRRDGLVAALAASGLLYELSVAAFAIGPDFRYSHWLVTCTCLALVFIAAAERERRRGAAAETVR